MPICGWATTPPLAGGGLPSLGLSQRGDLRQTGPHATQAQGRRPHDPVGRAPRPAARRAWCWPPYARSTGTAPTPRIADIAAEAGVSKPVLYRYFADKDELHAAVGQWGANEVLARMLPALSSDAPVRERIADATDAYLATHRGASPGLPAARPASRGGRAGRRQGRDRRHVRPLPRRHVARPRDRRRRRGTLVPRPGRTRALDRRVVARTPHDVARRRRAATSPPSSGTPSTAPPPTSAYPSPPSATPAGPAPDRLTPISGEDRMTAQACRARRRGAASLTLSATRGPAVQVALLRTSQAVDGAGRTVRQLPGPVC